jgi:YHS domain-containing protein
MSRAKTLVGMILNDFGRGFVYIGGMKRFLMTGLLGAAFVVASASTLAADKKDEKKAEYPLKKCVVSDEALDSMGKPYVMDYKGREVKLCCSSCKKDFDKNPEKYLKKLDEAGKKAKK